MPEKQGTEKINCRDELALFHAKDERFLLDGYDLSTGLSINLKKHVCSCGKIYSQKSSLDRHLRYECGKMPNVPCPQCGKMFKHKHHVTQHLKSYPAGRPYYHRSQPIPRQEADDQRVAERRFYCDNCGKSYKWKESLFKHKRVECGKLPQFSCEVCGYRFMHKHHLIKHMTSIHQLAPATGAVIFRCLKHLLAKRTFGCTNCGKQYARRDSLYKHTHYECGTEPRFGCTVCGRRFKRKHHLTYHVTNMHKTAPK
ncbi:PREDICTED: zinc finger protein 2-like [Dufourea novaeangliae]|uniref:zinc finger protein 2-like n=1 Tax=Dufourea novaeangliae TaxID=178035 RepID=UPI000766E40E|nr:PREDICTED: zinc finger protein 2-like [Dufourea novaeangliae]